MIAAAATEAQAYIDCSATYPTSAMWGSGGYGTTGTIGTVTIVPGAACDTGTNTIPLGNLDGFTCPNQVKGINATVVRMDSTQTYAAVTSIDLECLRGTLYVNSTNLAELHADSLTMVGNDILVESNSGLNDATFDGLVDMGTTGNSNDIVFKSNPGLLAVNFASLKTIAGSLEFSSNGALPNLTGFPLLTDIANYLKIFNNPMLDMVMGEFPSLTVIGAYLMVSGNPSLTTLEIPSLGAVSAMLGGTGILLNANNLMSLDLSGLVILDHTFAIISEPNLMNAGIVPLTLPMVGTHVTFSNNASLDTLGAFASITDIGGDLTIDNNDVLVDITGISGVANIGGGLTVRGQAALPTVNFPTIPALNRLEIRDNDMMVTMGFASLAAIGTELNMYGNAALPDVGLTTVGFPVLAMIGTQLNVQAQTAMTDLVFPALAAMGWQLWVSYNPALTLVDFPALAAIGGELHFNNNVALPAIGGPLVGAPGFPVLGAIAKRIYLDNNTALAYFRLPALTVINAPIGGTAPQAWIKVNTAMTRFVLDTWADPAGACGPGDPSLARISAQANMGVCPDLTAIKTCFAGIVLTCIP